MDKPIKDVTDDIEFMALRLPDALDYALHFITEYQDVVFRFSDVEISIKGV